MGDDFDTELRIIMGMSPPERKLFYQERAVDDETNRLQWMIEQNKQDSNAIAAFIARARREIAERDDIQAAEEWAAIAQSMHKHRFTIAEIRKQRERIQWEKRQLKALIASQPTEPEQSSNH